MVTVCFGYKALAAAFAAVLALTVLPSCDMGWEDLASIDTGSTSTTSSEAAFNQNVASEQTSFQEEASSDPVSSEDVAVSAGDSWNLVLVNPTHPVENITQENLVELTVSQKRNGNGKYFDKRAADYVYQMFDAAKAEGIHLLSRSTFRTYNLQKTYFDSSYNGYLNQGLSEAEAKRRTLEYTAYPGTSEHHTGLAIDITTDEWEAAGKGLNDSFADTDAAKWLKDNAHKYGFILRYPKDKEEITKIKFEPWHYRFVGVAAATEIYNTGVCFEEYLGILD